MPGCSFATVVNPNDVADAMQHVSQATFRGAPIQVEIATNPRWTGGPPRPFLRYHELQEMMHDRQLAERHRREGCLFVRHVDTYVSTKEIEELFKPHEM